MKHYSISSRHQNMHNQNRKKNFGVSGQTDQGQVPLKLPIIVEFSIKPFMHTLPENMGLYVTKIYAQLTKYSILCYT